MKALPAMAILLPTSQRQSSRCADAERHEVLGRAAIALPAFWENRWDVGYEAQNTGG
jgi:hypothetical protein